MSFLELLCQLPHLLSTFLQLVQSLSQLLLKRLHIAQQPLLLTAEVGHSQALLELSISEGGNLCTQACRDDERAKSCEASHREAQLSRPSFNMVPPPPLHPLACSFSRDSCWLHHEVPVSTTASQSSELVERSLLF